MLENILSMVVGGLLVTGGYMLCYFTNKKQAAVVPGKREKVSLVGKYDSPLNSKLKAIREERYKNSIDNGLDQATGKLVPKRQSERKEAK